MEIKQLKLGVVQIDSHVGERSRNLEHAGELVEITAKQDAQLVLLRELMPGGYTLTEAIWDCAEPFCGPTVAWLIRTAKRLGIYLGTSFLEAEGDDFYNTFALASPAGNIAGIVRKCPSRLTGSLFLSRRCGFACDRNRDWAPRDRHLLREPLVRTAGGLTKGGG